MTIIRNVMALGVALMLLGPAAAQQTEPAKTGADKPTLSTYDNKPPAQVEPVPSDPERPETERTDPETSRPDLNNPPTQYDDTSDAADEDKTKGDEDVIPTYNKKADPRGKNQDFPAETYDKKPNPAGDQQKLDAVRYEERNEANDGLEAPTNLEVIEGDVETQ